MIVTFFCVGLRVSELCGLNVEDTNLRQGNVSRCLRRHDLTPHCTQIAAAVLMRRSASADVPITDHTGGHGPLRASGGCWADASEAALPNRPRHDNDMLWLYERDRQALHVETKYDDHTSEYVVVVDHPLEGRLCKRFRHRADFRAWLVALDHVLEDEHWMPRGPLVLVAEGTPGDRVM